jgi:hypothetical protein
MLYKRALTDSMLSRAQPRDLDPKFRAERAPTKSASVAYLTAVSDRPFMLHHSPHYSLMPA